MLFVAAGVTGVMVVSVSAVEKFLIKLSLSLSLSVVVTSVMASAMRPVPKTWARDSEHGVPWPTKVL